MVDGKETKLRAELGYRAGGNIAATVREGDVLHGEASGHFTAVLAYLGSIGVATTEMKYATTMDERRILGLK